jgi:polar amino acid transport system substrate-binding protein
MNYKSLIITGLLGSVFLTACSQSNEQAATDSSNKVIAVGSDLTFPPYEFLKDGTPSGVSVEMMEKIATLQGAKTNWVDTRWANLIPGLKGEKFDILFSSMYITKERLQQIDMIPYYKTDISLLVRQDSDLDPQGPNDLCGKTVGAMKGTAFSSQVYEISKQRCEAQGLARITVREFETSPQTTQALLAHAVDIQYDDAAVMQAAAHNLSGKVKVTSTEEFFPTVGGIGIRKGDTETYALVEEGIAKLKASGEFEKILASYGLKAPTDADIAAVMKPQ